MTHGRTLSKEDEEVRRKSLVKAATKLFAKQGYHATTVDMIIAEAESSSGIFHAYFRDKEDVFNAALEELGQETSHLVQAIDHSQHDVIKRLSQRLQALFIFFAQRPEHARILLVESSRLSVRLEKTREAILMRQEEHLRQTLDSAPAQLEVQNTQIAARCMVGAAFEALLRWLEENPKTRQPALEVARAVADFSNRAVRRSPAIERH